ncbi:5'-nucleotidase domain-containing protein DDB_G0275467 [Linum perenne]
MRRSIRSVRYLVSAVGTKELTNSSATLVGRTRHKDLIHTTTPASIDTDRFKSRKFANFTTLTADADARVTNSDLRTAGPLVEYERRIAAGDLVDGDNCQLGTLTELQRLFDEIVESADACKLDRYATSEKSTSWRKKRIHFHDFMLNVHSRLQVRVKFNYAFTLDLLFEGHDRFRLSSSQRHRGVADPLEVVAGEISDEAILLCLDEFMVTDVADALILNRLFGHLFNNGVILVATSNRNPDKLYEGGLQRDLFLPFIETLKAEQGFYFVGENISGLLKQKFKELVGKHEVGSEEVEVVMGRKLQVPYAADGCAYFKFEELCDRPLGAADYFGLFKNFHTLALEGIPILGFNNRTAAYRFVTLIDVMYENRARLLCTAEGTPFELFEKIVTIADAQQMAPRTSGRSRRNDQADLCVDNELGFAKDRTISRQKDSISINAKKLRLYLLPWLPFESSRLYAPIHKYHFILSTFLLMIVRFGGNVRSYSIAASASAQGLKSEAEASCFDDEVAKIRHQFEAAKNSFLSMPESLAGMPKMNPKGIYVNKNLRLDNIQVYGFDYDYTLAHYSSNLQSLIYDLAKEHMVNELRYPEICMRFTYDPTFPIRGLYYDRKNGCLLKLDFFGSIEPDGCYFGRRKLSRKEIEVIYGTRHIGRDQARGLVGLMDFFCFSEACLIADIVQHFVDAKLEFDASYIYQDVNRAIQHVHRSGSAHRGILSNPQKYLLKNHEVLRFLKMLREKGKKLFLLTNSPYYFVDGGMRYMLEDSIGCGDSWRDLFDVVIAKANKPDFYTSEHPFRCYDTERDTLAFTKVETFVQEKIYYHGCLKTFLEITKWRGPEVIYFGDHLFSDLRGPSKAGWRTAAIIRELENEIRIQNGDRYRFEQAKFHIIQELLGRLHSIVPNSNRSESYGLLLEELNQKRQEARRTMRKMFNKSFGATFLTDTGQESAFAYHIHQYADVYTSKPENFLLYPPEAWLHVPFDVKIMPHHVKVSSSLCSSNQRQQ